MKYYAWCFYSDEDNEISQAVNDYVLDNGEQGFDSIEDAVKAAEDNLIKNFSERKRMFDDGEMTENPYEDGFFIVDENTHEAIKREYEEPFYLNPFDVIKVVSVEKLMDEGKIED